jgi:hypothetical protein
VSTCAGLVLRIPVSGSTDGLNGTTGLTFRLSLKSERDVMLINISLKNVKPERIKV